MTAQVFMTIVVTWSHLTQKIGISLGWKDFLMDMQL